MAPSAPRRLILVDASGYIFRAYFALRQQRPGGRSVEMTTSTGMPTGALYVFASMLMRLYLDEKPDLCAVVFDDAGRTFREEVYPQYKANRRQPPPDLVPQFPWFERIARAFQLPVVRAPGVEADDVIASLVRAARTRGLEVSIFGADKDLMQLVDEHVHIVDTMRDVIFDPARVKAKFGVPPRLVGDWLALRGDSTDNIPGVAGVGEVTATKLLVEHGSIEGILAHVDELPAKLQARFKDPAQLAQLELSRKLVALKDDVDLPEVTTLRRRDWDAAALAEIFRALEFNRFLARLEAVFVSDRERYRVILDERALEDAVAGFSGAGELAVYFATTGPAGVAARLVGVALAAPGLPPAYIPVGHRYLGAPAQLDAARVLARLAPLLEDAGLAKHVHDVKQAHLLLEPHGVALRGLRSDPMIAAHLLDPYQTGHALGALAKQLLDHETVESHLSFDEVDVAAATTAGAESAEVTLALGTLLLGRVEQAAMAPVLADVELPLAHVLAVMERHGIKVDVAYLRELGQKLGEDCQRLERQIHEIAGFPLNPLSTKQVGELLFEKLGLRSEHMRRTKSGGFSTDAEQLEEMIGLHPIIRPLLEHRELVKLKGTYLDPLPQWVNPRTGRVHTSYSQVSASTGRLASINPNIQNIPIRGAIGRQIRRGFVAEEGHVLVSADYSQIELRVLAHLSGDPVLLEAFARDVDVHAQTAAEVFGIPLAEVTADHRRVAKAVNYGLGYGQTDYGLARALDISRDEARRYIETYFHRFARVREFMEATVAEVRRTQLTRTLLGRRIPIPGITSGRAPERSAGERVARNAPIQGSAADILKLAMLRMQALINNKTGRSGGAKMLLTVHDELVFEVAEASAERFVEEARREMEAAYTLRVPLKVDVGISRTWAEAH